ncbi:hypothetical protein GC167_00995 [bacterium]|nr:hypothetical protein [bacterium]
MNLFPDDLFESLDASEVLEALAQCCTTSEAEQRCRELRPLSVPELVEAALDIADQALQQFQRGFALPSPAFELEPGTLSLLGIKGACLQSSQFLEIKQLCSVYAGIYAYCREHGATAPALGEMVSDAPPLPEVPKAIDRVFDLQGEVRSNASSALQSIRNELSRKRILADRLFLKARQKWLDKGFLGDISETVFDNRRVLAIQAAYKNQVSGLLHGSSSRHSLYYLEPAECIETNNEVALLLDEERKEIQRILTALTAELSIYSPDLECRRSILVRFDFVRAKGWFAHKTGASRPVLVEQGVLELRQAYNPVLWLMNRTKGKPTVPVDLRLDPNTRILVVSGPNAGGKSVALKTVGLLQIMVQSGLLVPVDPRSVFGVFQGIAADIGDSQSIENELSTYSSRLLKTKAILERSTEGCVFLIDEFGSGSDPELGSALAEEVLDRLHQSGALGVITTHFNRIKALANELDGVVNGSMEFDQATLSPLYKLQTGMPGSSYTFEVAHRSGLDTGLIRSAKQRLSKDKVKLDRMLVEIENERQRIKNQRQALESELAELRKLRRDQERTIGQLEEKLQRQGAMNEQSSRQLMWGKRFGSLAAEWLKARGKKDKDAVMERILTYLGEQGGALKKEKKKEHAQAQKRREEQLERLKALPIAVGDEVVLLGTRQKGQVEQVRNGRYTVTFGNIKSTVERDRIAKAEPKPPKLAGSKSSQQKEDNNSNT